MRGCGFAACKELRVMDLSVAPTMLSGNTNGPVMAMAWRAAALFEEDRRQRNVM